MKTLSLFATIFGLAFVPPALAQNKAPEAPKPAATAEALTDATSDGAIKLFVKHMKEADFVKASEMIDTSSESYGDFERMGKEFDPATANPAIEPAQLEFIRRFFADPWKDVEVKKLAEQGPRAQFKLTFFATNAQTKQREERNSLNVDLNQFEQKWRVLATQEMLRPMTPNQPAAAPAAPAEAPKAPEADPAKPAGGQ
jgi:hypothetical protein